MNIKELKAALDVASEKLKASPDDAALKAAFEGAKSEYESALADSEDDEDDSSSGKKGDEDDDSLDESGLDEKTKAHLKKLRKENAKHRTKAKNLEDRLGKLESGLKSVFGEEDDSKPEEKIGALKGQNEALSFKTAVLEAALEHGVNKDDREYFEFLVAKKVNGLEEGEELSEDDLADIASNAKKKSGGGGTRTSVDDSGAGNPKPSGKVTLDQFVAMNMTEKSTLFTKNRALYDELFAQAKQKRRI